MCLFFGHHDTYGQILYLVFTDTYTSLEFEGIFSDMVEHFLL